MPEITFEFEIGDVVMVRPTVGSNTIYEKEIKDYHGNVTTEQWRITQRRYVEEINGVGKIGYMGHLVTSIDKSVSLPEAAIIRVDDYLAKKAIVDSNKPKPNQAKIIRGTAAQSPTIQTLLPGIKEQYNQTFQQFIDANMKDLAERYKKENIDLTH
jgi:hypothetical protein